MHGNAVQPFGERPFPFLRTRAGGEGTYGARASVMYLSAHYSEWQARCNVIVTLI